MSGQRVSFLCCGVLAASLVIGTPAANAEVLFGLGDPIIAVDIDLVVDSSYPGPEGPGNVADQVSGTKYLNFGKEGTGFIITPAQGASITQSLQVTAANDARERDPLTYDLYGTNDAIISGDNSAGNQETWALISSGLTGLAVDPGREMPGTIEDFTNGTSYTSYKVIFPTIENPGGTNSMQVADVSLFTEPGGAGTQILAAADPALAVADPGSASDYPGAESPPNAIDADNSTKYLNLGKENSGFIVNRSDGKATTVNGLTFTTAINGGEENRDPMTWDLWGTDDPVTSADNSLGDQETWTLVDSGLTGFETDPGRGAAAAPQVVNNSTAYGAYRLVFPTLRGGSDELMQIGDVLIEGTVVPEPSSIALVAMAMAAAVLGIRRR